MSGTKHIPQFELIQFLWHVLPVGQFEYAVYLQGWRRPYPVSWKKVYQLDDMVMKFDWPQDKTKSSHTAHEYRVWKNAKPAKRRYLVTCLFYSDGLLIQSKLSTVCDVRNCRCDDAERIGRRLRIMDWLNHGRTASGSLKFFDYDNTGSGWWNWHRKNKTASRGGHGEGGHGAASQ